MEYDRVPKNWTCPACALLGVRGATHTYLLDQPYKTPEACRMTRVEGTSEISVDRSEPSQGANHPGSSHRQSEDIPEPDPAGRAYSTPRPHATDSQERSLLDRMDQDTTVPLNVTEKAGVWTDNTCRLNLISPQQLLLTC